MRKQNWKTRLPNWLLAFCLLSWVGMSYYRNNVLDIQTSETLLHTNILPYGLWLSALCLPLAYFCALNTQRLDPPPALDSGAARRIIRLAFMTVAVAFMLGICLTLVFVGVNCTFDRRPAQRLRFEVLALTETETGDYIAKLEDPRAPHRTAHLKIPRALSFSAKRHKAIIIDVKPGLFGLEWPVRYSVAGPQ